MKRTRKNTRSKNEEKPKEEEIDFINNRILFLVPLLFTTILFWPFSLAHIPVILRRPSFIPGFATTYIISFLFFFLILWANDWLNRKYKWEEQFLKRSILQFFIGIVTPILFAIVFSKSYFDLLGLNITMLYSRHILPLVILFTVGANIIFCLVYQTKLFKKMGNIAQTAQDQQWQEQQNYTRFFMVPNGNSKEKIPIEDIAYAYKDGPNTILKTHDGQSKILWHSIEELQPQLDPTLFNKISRAYIISCTAVKSIEKTENRGLLLTLSPKTTNRVKVGREKANQVINWLRCQTAHTQWPPS